MWWQNSQKWFITQKIFEKHFTFLLFKRFILKDQPWRTYSWAHLRKEAGSWARTKNFHNFYPVRRSSRERRVLRSSTTSSQCCDIITTSSVRCCCIRGFRVVHPVFSTAAWSTGHQIRFQITNDPFAPQILETDSPPLHHCVMPSPMEHQCGASCPGSKPHPVMTGWQCWQGSAEPTTPPGLWAQSLHRNNNSRGPEN